MSLPPWDRETPVLSVKDPHPGSARLCLNTDVFLRVRGGASAGVGPLGTACPGCPARERVPAIPARQLPHTAVSGVSLWLHLFANVHLPSFLFLTGPQESFRCKMCTNKLWGVATNEVCLTPEASSREAPGAGGVGGKETAEGCRGVWGGGAHQPLPRSSDPGLTFLGLPF